MSQSDVAAIKSQLREALRVARNALGPEVRQDCDRQICRFLLEASIISQAETVAAYIAFDGEPDLHPLLRTLGSRGKTIALPVITGSGQPLAFHRWHPDCIMTPNQFGIPEPLAEPPIALEELDILLMPLAGWDRTGGRLGLGGGFYDRTLGNSRLNQLPTKVGVAYAAQEQERIPMEKWDVRLDAIVSEEGWFTCPS